MLDWLMTKGRKARSNVRHAIDEVDPGTGDLVAEVVDVDDPDDPGRKKRVRRIASPLRRMLHRGQLSESEYLAGLRFSACFERAGLIGRYGNPDPMRVRVDGGPLWREPIGSVASADARREIEAALEYVGARSGFVLTYLVGHGEEQDRFLFRCAAMRIRCDRNAIRSMLQLALSALSAFYDTQRAQLRC